SGLEEIDRLTKMCEDLLLITRAESRLIEVQRVPTDPNAVVRRALQGLQSRLAEKQLRVEADLDPAAAAVSLDPALVTQLVEHLLDNAVKYTPTGGRVRIATERGIPAHRGVRLAVENTGSSIAPEDLPHIFEAFYRADRARSRGTGT